MTRNELQKWLVSAASAALFMGLTSQAHASMVQLAYQDTAFVQGSQASYSQNAFTISNAGDYVATLKDFVFPEHFDQLGLIITTNGTQTLGQINLGADQKVGSFAFHADPGTYDANLYALAGSTLQLGLYGVSVSLGPLPGTSGSPAPVPLPPSALMLATALMALAIGGRRGRGRQSAGLAV